MCHSFPLQLFEALLVFHFQKPDRSIFYGSEGNQFSGDRTSLGPRKSEAKGVFSFLLFLPFFLIYIYIYIIATRILLSCHFHPWLTARAPFETFVSWIRTMFASSQQRRKQQATPVEVGQLQEQSQSFSFGYELHQGVLN